MGQLETPESAKDQRIADSDIKSNFVKNIKDDIEKIFYGNDFSGSWRSGEGNIIQAITSELREGKGASQAPKNTQQVKAQERNKLIELA